jgi:hypothetical protein
MASHDSCLDQAITVTVTLFFISMTGFEHAVALNHSCANHLSRAGISTIFAHKSPWLNFVGKNC